MRKSVIAAALAAGLLSAASASAQIKIGFHAPQSGPAAADGKSSTIGAEIARDWINEKGGVLGQKIELVIYDDQNKPDQAVPIANKLIGEDKVKVAVSGSYSAPTRAAAAVFQTAHIPYFSAYGVHPDITSGGNWAFRGVTLGPPQGKGAAKFIADKFGKVKVTMLTMNNDFGQSIADGFKEEAPKLGLTITKEYTFGLGERQFGPIVASVKNDDPGVIYAIGYYFVGGPLVAQLRAGGLKQPIVGAQAFDSMKLMEIAKDAAEGVFVVGGMDRTRTTPPDMQPFQAEFKKRAGYGVEAVAANCYSSVMLIADAIKRAGSTEPAKIRDAIAATKNFPMLTGKLGYFNSIGEIYMPLEVTVVKGGNFVGAAVIDDQSILAPPK
ncbi:MAG TPA: ABC transporter substrate-binding protein [Reyranella sp.]|nr:ABC transporter substrate-binding protein [Reyranella sp.]